MLIITLFFPTCMQTWDNISNAEVLEAIAVLLMLFVSFVLPWFTAFFFEFKVR